MEKDTKKWYENQEELVNRYQELLNIAKRVEEIRCELWTDEKHRKHMGFDEFIKRVDDTLFKVQSDLKNLVQDDLCIDMLKEDYKNYYFREYEDFENFIKVYAGREYFPRYDSYYRDGDLYYIMVDFLRSKYTREDLLSPEVSKVDTIVLEEGKDGNFKIALNGFVESISHNNSKTVEDVTFTLQNSVRNTETMETNIVVTNNSDSVVNVSTSNIQPIIMGGNSAKTSVTSSIHLNPGETGMLQIEFYMQYNSGKEFNGITITGASFSDGTILEDINLPK